jgi:hypothetical protein
MKLSSLQYKFSTTEPEYIKSAKLNASTKRDLEIRLLQNKNQLLPIAFNKDRAYVCYSPEENNIESEELVKEWIRDLRLDKNNKEILTNNIASHDAFITLFCLNKLRKLGIPNFIYYYGVIRFNHNYFALTEQVFNKEYKNWPTFKEICEKSSYNEIFEFYLSVLLSVYSAHKYFEYTNYGLTCETVLMKPQENVSFDVEYHFRNNQLFINNKNYVPLITNNEKSYVKMKVDSTMKSFGYNNIDDVPFEFKGIYCDRAFPITDAYSLLQSIIKTTEKCNPTISEKFKRFNKFFTDNGYTQFNQETILYHKATENLHLGDYIAYLVLSEESLVKFESNKSLLRCTGVNLEVKNNSAEYYNYKNLLQLCDYNRSLNIMKNFSIDDSVIRREMTTFKTLEEEIINHIVIHKISNSNDLLYNKKYIEILYDNLTELINYYNNWERLKTRIIILNSLVSSFDALTEVSILYSTLFNENKIYYDTLIAYLKDLRKILSDKGELYDKFIEYTLFLESIE